MFHQERILAILTFKENFLGKLCGERLSCTLLNDLGALLASGRLDKISSDVTDSQACRFGNLVS